MYELGRRLAEEIELQVVRMRYDGSSGAERFHTLNELANRFRASLHAVREAAQRLRAAGFLDWVNGRLWTVPIEELGLDSLKVRLRGAPEGEARIAVLREAFDTRRVVASVAFSRCARRSGKNLDLLRQVRYLRTFSSPSVRPDETVDALWKLADCAVHFADSPGLRSIFNSLHRSWDQLRLWEMLARDCEAASRLGDELERALTSEAPPEAVAAWTRFEEHMTPRIVDKARITPDPLQALGNPWLQPRIFPDG